MIINEIITVIPPASDIKECKRRLRLTKLIFNWNEEWFRFQGEYSPDRFEECLRYLSAPDTWEIKHSIFTDYDKNDFQNAPLVQVLLPDSGNGIRQPGAKSCPSCTRMICKPTYKVLVQKFLCEDTMVNWGFGGVLVKNSFSKRLSRNLSGVELYPFDKEENYCHLAPRTTLGPMLIDESDYTGLEGRCLKCDKPKYKMYFGPLRYSKDAWSGDDIVEGGLFNGPLFSQKALAFFKSSKVEFKAYTPVVLE